MNLKHIFNNWAKETAGKYQDQQWLLSKWDVLDGVNWTHDKIDLLIGHIRAYLDIHPSCSRLLDVGCGGGWILDEIGGIPKLSVGCDVAIEMLKNASGKFPLINGDICFLPFRESIFDRILCYFVFINFADEFLIEEAIADMIRVLKPGGKMLIGQLPDRERSDLYETEKKHYVEYCQNNFQAFSSNRDICHIPVQLFDKKLFEQIFMRFGCKINIIPSFNPFYRPGEAERINWRFDVVAEKK